MFGVYHPQADPLMPTWDVARLFPNQGSWSEADYLQLPSNHLVEFSDGFVEVLPMPTTTHQLIVLFLYRALSAFVAGKLGTVAVAPLRVRLWEGKFREPDILFMKAENGGRIGEQYWEGADLVMEVVSDDDRRRDVDTKRTEYAEARIAEYWIVDPRERRITVLELGPKKYEVHGEFARGTRADSVLLPGFGVDVAETFAQGPVITS